MPAYPASVIANYTLYTGRIYAGPVSTSSIVNRSGIGDVEDLLGVGITDLTGYAPDGTTTVAEMAASDNYSAWLHGETATFPPDTVPVDGPYFNNTPSYIVVKQPLNAIRANGQDLALIDHRGRGTGPSFVLQSPTPFIQFETTAGDAANLRVWNGATTTSIATLSLDSRVRLGTGSVDSWIAAGIWWDGAGNWRVIIEADFDDGVGRQVLVDDNTITGGTFDGANLTRVRALAPQVFGSYCFGQGPEEDFIEAMAASIYEVETLLPPPDPIPPDPPRWTPGILLRYPAMWLLEVTVGGREFFFAERPVVAVDERGRSRVYQEGLGSIVAGWASEGTPERSIGIELDAASDWSALVAPGRSLERSAGRLLRWIEGALYETARVFLEGSCEGLQHGDELEPLSFALTRASPPDSSPIPPARAAVDSATWPVRSGWSTAASADGAGYPLVIGQPGSATVPASPAPLVETDHASLTTDRALVCGGRVDAAMVTVFDVTDAGAWESLLLAVATTTDLAGRTVSYVEVGGEFTVPTDSTRRYEVAWTGGAGLLDPTTGRPLHGAGDVLAWLFRTFTRTPFDDVAFAASRSALNAYLVDTFVDQSISAVELANSIAAMLPVDLRQGPNGVYYGLRRLEVRAEEAVASLSADRREIERDGPVEVRSGDLVNEVAVAYAPQGSGSMYTRRVIVTGQDRADELDAQVRSADDARVLVTYRATLSQREHGLHAIEIELPHVHDDATARQVALDAITAQAFPRRGVRYRGGAELEAIQPDDVVLLTDSALLLDQAPALVLDVAVGGPDLALDLLLYDDPVLG